MMKRLFFFSTLAAFWLAACINNSPAPAPAEETSAAAPPVPDSSVHPSRAPSPAVAAPAPGEKRETGMPAPEKSVTGAPALPAMRAPAPPAPGKGGGDAFSDVAELDPSILLDIRYATANNFTQSKIYDCPACLLRPEAARALVKAHQTLQKKGMGLKMYDCYRPRPYQQRLWNKVPNPDYVTPPSKGSMHSRGAAVDLTIVDSKGNELDMGTPYDFFGPEAHTDNTKLPAKVLANRRLLRETLEAAGFQGIRTEWWHFSFRGKNYPLSDYVWSCE